MSKQYIGVLLQRSLYRRLKEGKRKQIDIGFFEEAARKNNLIPCYFLVRNLAGRRDTAPALVNNNGVFQEKIVEVPRVIYNRDWNMPSRQRIINQLTKQGIIVFNEKNYLRKYKFQAILEDNKEFLRYLPETKIASPQTLKEMMQKYHQLILKPENGLRGRGIHKLQKLNKKEWKVSYKTEIGERGVWKEIIFSETIPEYLEQLIKKNTYLIQNFLPLATYHGSPFDLRVATQRNRTGDWEVSAIIAKVAGEGSFLTNIEQGGTSYTLNKILEQYPHLNAEHVREQIVSLAIKIANLFSRHLPHIGDLGFDFAITPKGDLYYIECNFVSGYKGFTIKDGVLLHDEWKAVFTKPADYARFLLDNNPHNN